MESFVEYKITTQDVHRAVSAVQEAFSKKRLLEKEIAKLIKSFEVETGLAVDSIRYQRDITLPIRSAKYTDLTILISAEE